MRGWTADRSGWRTLAWAIVALLAGAPISAAAQAADSPASPSPWRRAPDPDDIALYYPDRAADAEVTGAAMVRCRVGPAGEAADCAILSETPSGYGFGEATIRALRRARFRTTDDAGQSMVGRAYRIPMRWELLSDEAAGRLALECEAMQIAFGISHESLSARARASEEKAAVDGLTRNYVPGVFRDRDDARHKLAAAIAAAPESTEDAERKCRRLSVSPQPRLDPVLGCAALKVAHVAKAEGRGSRGYREELGRAAAFLQRRETMGMASKAIARDYVDSRVSLLLSLPALPEMPVGCSWFAGDYIPF